MVRDVIITVEDTLITYEPLRDTFTLVGVVIC